MRSAGKLSIPRFAPMPPGVDVAATASTPPKSFRSRPIWPTAATVPATPAAAVSHSRRDAAPIGSSLASGFVNTTPGGRPTDTRSGYRAQPPVPPARRPLASGVEPRLSSPQGAESHGADSESSDDRADPSLLRRPRRGRRSGRAARRGDVSPDLRRVPGILRARLPRAAADRRDADGVQPSLRSARDDDQGDRPRESAPPEPGRPLEHGSRTRRRAHGLDGPAHALPVRQPALAHRQLVQTGAGDGVLALGP